MTHLIRLAESDPSLTLNLFLTVNEHLNGSKRPPAGLIQHAILVLGIAAFNERFTALPRLEAIGAGADTRTLVAILARGHHAARQARALAELAPGVNSGEVMAAALVEQASGYLNVLVEQFMPGFEPPGRDRILASLPPLLRVDAAESMARQCVTYGARVARAVSDYWDDARLAPLYDDIASCLARDPAAIAHTIKLTAVTTAREAMHFPCCPAAVHLMSPGRPPRASNAVKPASTGPSIKLARPVEKARADGTRIENALRSLTAAGKRGRSSGEILSFALQSICRCTGYRLAALVVRDKRSGDLVLRINEGAPLPEEYVNLRLSPAENPLLEKLLCKASALALDGAASPAIAGMLDHKLGRLIGNHKACLYSVFVGDRALGLVLACRPCKSGQSDDASFAAFKQICGTTVRALERLRGTRGRRMNAARLR